MLFSLGLALLVGGTVALLVMWDRVEEKMRTVAEQTIRKKLGVAVTLGGLQVRSTGVLLRDLLVPNGPPGPGKAWAAPFVLQLKLFRMRTSGPLTRLRGAGWEQWDEEEAGANVPLPERSASKER